MASLGRGEPRPKSRPAEPPREAGRRARASSVSAMQLVMVISRPFAEAKRGGEDSSGGESEFSGFHEAAAWDTVIGDYLHGSSRGHYVASGRSPG